MDKIKLIVLIAIISVLIAGCVQTPKQDINPSTTVAPTLTSTTTPTSTATSDIYYVGETASDGVVNITLNGLRYTAVINEKNLVKAQPGNTFIILDITLKIIKNGEKRFYPQGGPFRIGDSNGYVYTTNQQEHEALKQGLASAQNLTYGDKVRGELAFEIPENNNDLTFQFLFDSDNRVTFKLGDTPAPTINSIPETPNAPKLKIMSVTVGQATIYQVPITIKVKNIGDAVAKDVYAGIVRTSYSPPVSYENYPDKSSLLNQSIHEALMNGSSRIDTGFLYRENDRIFNDLIISSYLTNKDYIGDISPGEIKIAQITQSVGEVYNIMVKVAWTDDKKEYTIY